MKRLKLLLAMVSLGALIVVAVMLGSPYAPVVDAAPENIEEIWAIEDARVESGDPLVTRLENNGAPLGYDSAANTFYCTLGMENGDDWPKIHLTAPGAKGVKLVFTDDYSYDSCADAIREGYPYEVLAYNDTHYFYTYVVFTGLPIIRLEADADIPAHVDVPVQVSISWPGEETLLHTGRAHRRGATSLNLTPKNGFKVEFTRGVGGSKTQAEVPFLGMTDDMTLLACSIDPLMIRDRLSWDLYNAFMDADEAFGDMETRYVELFIDDDYHGVYLLMKQYDYAQEMAKAHAQAALTDSYYRTVDQLIENPERPVIVDHLGHSYEQFYAAPGETDFQSIRPYLQMTATEDDALFSRRVLERIDLDSMIRYALLVEACGMMDNEYNNLGIWAYHGADGLKYRFVPWDLDVSWGLLDGYNAEEWYTFDLLDRMLRLDCGGVVRARTLEIWQELRGTVFNIENVETLLRGYSRTLNDSGAFYRNTMRWKNVRKELLNIVEMIGGEEFLALAQSWRDERETLDTAAVHDYAFARFDMMDRYIAQIADAGFAGRQIRLDQDGVSDAGALDTHLMGLE